MSVITGKIAKQGERQPVAWRRCKFAGHSPEQRRSMWQSWTGPTCSLSSSPSGDSSCRRVPSACREAAAACAWPRACLCWRCRKRRCSLRRTAASTSARLRSWWGVLAACRHQESTLHACGLLGQLTLHQKFQIVGGSMPAGIKGLRREGASSLPCTEPDMSAQGGPIARLQAIPQLSMRHLGLGCLLSRLEELNPG